MANRLDEKRRVLAILLTLASRFAFGQPGMPQYEPWGFDLHGMDHSVRPGDDFFRYSGGTWMKVDPSTTAAHRELQKNRRLDAARRIRQTTPRLHFHIEPIENIFAIDAQNADPRWCAAISTRSRARRSQASTCQRTV